MPSRPRSSLPAFARHSADIAFAAPEVMAHRLLRFSMAGATPSRRDVAEFQRMWLEKATVAQESWTAMMMQAFDANLQLALSMGPSWWTLTPDGMRRRLASHAGHAASSVLAAGLAPVHRRVLGNARRLRRARRHGSR